MQEKTFDGTIRLYYEDAYMMSFEARVLSCTEHSTGYRIELDRTAFFPEGGGQLGDLGYLQDGESKVHIFNTVEEDGTIYHLGDRAIASGTSVRGYLDEETRFDKMQQHSAEHILCGLAHNLYGCENVGFHLGDDITTFDLDGSLTDEQIEELEQKANEIIWKNVSITTSFPSPEEAKAIEFRSKMEFTEQVRLVTIEGVDVCACCAPHVKSTGEIGLVKIVDAISYKGGVRCTLVAGKRALSDYGRKHKAMKTLSSIYSVPIAGVLDADEKSRVESETRRLEILMWQERYIEAKANEPAYDENISEHMCILFTEDMDMDVIRKFVNKKLEHRNIVAVFSGCDENGYKYIVGRKPAYDLDLAAFAKEMNRNLSGRGGGKPEMVTGRVEATRNEIEEYLR